MFLVRNQKSTAMFFSILPGAGHMYLGLQKQGIQIMALFFLTIFLNDWLHIGFFGIIIPIIWFYAMFDVREKAKSEIPPEDKDLDIIAWLNSKSNSSQNTSKFLGIILIAVGCIALIDKIVFPILDTLISWNVRNYLQTGLVSLIFVALGIKLLLGSKKY